MILTILLTIIGLILSGCSCPKPKVITKTVYVEVYPDLKIFDINLSEIEPIEISYKVIPDGNTTDK